MKVLIVLVLITVTAAQMAMPGGDGGGMMALIKSQSTQESGGADDSPAYVVSGSKRGSRSTYMDDDDEDDDGGYYKSPGISPWKHRADFDRNDRQHDVMKYRLQDQDRRGVVQEMKMENFKDNMMMRNYPPFPPYGNPEKKTSVLDKVISMRK